jgi:hypothetical protein
MATPDNEIRITVEDGSAPSSPNETTSSSAAGQGQPGSGVSNAQDAVRAAEDQRDILQEQLELFQRIYEESRSGVRPTVPITPAGFHRDKNGRLRAADGTFVVDTFNPASAAERPEKRNRGGEGEGGGSGEGDGPERDRNEGGSLGRRIEFAMFRGFGRYFGGNIGRAIFGKIGGTVGTALGNVLGQAAGRTALGTGVGGVTGGGGGGVGAGLSGVLGGGAGGIGGALASLATGALVVTAALTALGLAIGFAVLNLEEYMIKQVGMYNAMISQASGIMEAQNVISKIDTANELENELSDYAYLSGELQIEIRNLLSEIITLFHPLVVGILELLKVITFSITKSLEFFNYLKTSLQEWGVNIPVFGQAINLIAKGIDIAADAMRRDGIRKQEANQNKIFADLRNQIQAEEDNGVRQARGPRKPRNEGGL